MSCHLQICYTCGEVTSDDYRHITKPYLMNDYIYLCSDCEKFLMERAHEFRYGDPIQVVRKIKGVK